MRSLLVVVISSMALSVGVGPILASDTEPVPMWGHVGVDRTVDARIDEVLRGRPPEVLTPLPGGVVRWRPTYVVEGDRVRIEATAGLDRLVITVGDVVTGVITSDGAEYLVTGTAEMIEVTEAVRGTEPPVPRPDGTVADGGAMVVDPGPDGVVDLLVVYTPSAAAEAEGTVAVEQAIGDYVLATQQYLAASGTGAAVSLAAVVPATDDVGDDILQTLIELTFPKGSLAAFARDPSANPAKFDGVFCERGEADADVVVLVTGDDGTNAAGVAWLLDGLMSDRDYAFAVTKLSAGSLTFAHELGHLLGNGHDAANGGPGRTPYAQGYRVPGVARTIMAYPCEFQGLSECRRIGIFSNPDIDYAGLAMGHPASADASRNISEIWQSLSGWGWNDPPEVPSVAFEPVGASGGRYRATAEVVDTTSCSGTLSVDARDGSSPAEQPWSNQLVEPFEVTADLVFQDPASVRVEICATDSQASRTCRTIDADVCHGSGLYPDVGSVNPFDEDIGWASCRSVVSGYSDGSFRPSADVSRQAMSAFMYRLAGEPAFSPPGTPSFTDVPVSHPFFVEIEWMAAEGISTGYGDGSFRPSADVSRQAMSAFMYRLAGEPAFSPGTPSFTDVPVSHPFFVEIEWMAAEGVSTGYSDGSFRPSADVSRQAMTAMLRRLPV